MKIRSATCIACTFAALALAADPKATPEEARKFVNDAEQKLLLLGVDAARADWIKSTYITDDTEAVAAKLDEKAIAATVTYAKQATRFDGLKLDAETARNPKVLREAWIGWHAIAKPIRQDFVRYVALANKGARQLGFKDNGAMWRSKYDMAPDDFSRELDRL